MKHKTWSENEKTSIILDMLKGNKSAGEICKEYGVNESTVYRWREQALESIQNGFSDKRSGCGTDKKKDAEIERLHKIIGQQTVIIDYQKKISQLVSR